jgi:hypothetical protein
MALSHAHSVSLPPLPPQVCYDVAIAQTKSLAAQAMDSYRCGSCRLQALTSLAWLVLNHPAFYVLFAKHSIRCTATHITHIIAAAVLLTLSAAFAAAAASPALPHPTAQHVVLPSAPAQHAAAPSAQHATAASAQHAAAPDSREQACRT